MSNVGEQLPMAMAINNSNNNNNAQTFACKTCGKPFVSVQALGGHQNAHRTERFALKRRQIEMKRQLARQTSLLPCQTMTVAGPAAPWPPHHPAPYIINSMMPSEDDVAHTVASSSGLLGAEDVAEGIDLTLKL